MIDENLIRDSQQGNAQAFSRLISLVYDIIFCFALKWTGNRHNAEDITQQACIKLAKVIRQFRFESAFTTWLYRLVVNCANDWGRSEKRHHQFEKAPPDLQQSSSDSTAAPAELTRVLKQVEAMGKGFKETLLLVHAEGMTHSEAATILEVKESTISWRLHEIRKQLKILDESAEGGQ